jgi:diaminopimelate decarboxylase
MDHFLYKGGILHAEGVAIPEIAAAVGTPSTSIPPPP